MPDQRTVHFDHGLYLHTALEATAEAYASLMTIALEEGDGQTVAHFSDASEDFGPSIFDAFCNHALFESIQRYRDGAEAK